MNTSRPSPGHARLRRNAELARQTAIERNSAYVECWSGLLGLYYQALLGEHDDASADESDERKVFHFRHALHAGCLDTSRIAFDAATSGSYVQALMLTRHLLESWLQLRYSKARPDQIVRWFNTIERGAPREPKFGSILKEVIAHSDSNTSIAKMIDLCTELDEAAHPSSWLINQVRGDGTTMITLGGRYDARCAGSAFDRGTVATFGLLVELRDTITVPNQRWSDEFERLRELRDSNYPGFQRACDSAG